MPASAPIRKAVVSGRFYPADPAILEKDILAFLNSGTETSRTADSGHATRPWALMLPHAGYIYCGRVLGATLSGMTPPETVVILCPNHTGQGHPLGVWPSGAWQTPLAAFPIEESLAADISRQGEFAADTASHLQEHSIEVLLPFLQVLAGEKKPNMVPICVGTRKAETLQRAGEALGAALDKCNAAGQGVGLVISSDMNHYENEQVTLEKDRLALASILNGDPAGLLEVTMRRHISMCGAAPMALALFAARALGAPTAELVCHDTSAAASGDRERTVGYAGLRVYIEPQGAGGW